MAGEGFVYLPCVTVMSEQIVQWMVNVIRAVAVSTLKTKNSQ